MEEEPKVSKSSSLGPLILKVFNIVNNWWNATNWKLEVQFMSFADSHQGLPLALKYSESKSKSPSHSLDSPLRPFSYHHIASYTSSGTSVSHCDTKLQFYLQFSSWEKKPYVPLNAWLWKFSFSLPSRQATAQLFCWYPCYLVFCRRFRPRPVYPVWHMLCYVLHQVVLRRAWG